MRCPNCGFIRNIDFDECPYCGHVIGNQKFLNRRVIINKRSSIKLSTFLNILFVNLFIALLIIDIVTSFQYFLTLATYIVMAIAFAIFRLITKKKNKIMVIENLDFCFLTSLILITTLLPVYFLNNKSFANVWNSSSFLAHTNPGSLFAFLVIPTFLLVSSFVIVAMFFVSRKDKFRPLITGLILNFHFLLSLTLFILLMVAKNNESAAGYVIVYQDKPYDWLTIFEYVVISLSFIFNCLTFINFNAMLVGTIVNHSSTVYGRDKKD